MRAALKADDSLVRLHSAVALWQITSETGPAVTTATDLLKDSDPAVRLESLGVLGMLGTKAEAALPAINKLWDDPDPAISQSAARTMGRIGKPAVPLLRERLKEDSQASRWKALHALGLLGANCKSALADIAAVLHDKDAVLRVEAADCLGRLGPAAKDQVPALIQALKEDREGDVREQAAEALGRIGPDASSAREALTAATRDKDPEVCALATDALKRIEPKKKEK